ncbi:hypothetical protein ACF08M_12980 [Streptomyces sp. NPDC015032]|uniref:hypothetical protein n=1 Tax=Streptomyces sp. NPDC015032 TaxID=3364937 RepID=UPI0036FEF5A2
MTTGPENYRFAEELVRSVTDGRQIGDDVAQILATATVLDDHSTDESGMPLTDYDERVKVASGWKPRQKGGDA